jgi:hypothetical protein
MAIDEFTPASLSPLPVEPLPGPLPYGLDWADIQQALPGEDPARADGRMAFASYAKQGLHGGDNSCIFTLRYPRLGGGTAARTVFIKHATEPAKREAAKYRFLAARRVPAPELLAAVERAGAEVVVLEFLSTIGIDCAVAAEVDALLALVARLNAVRDPPDIFAPPPGVPRAEFEARVRAALEEVAADGSLPGAVDARQWFDVYRRADAVAEASPRALNHGELFFQQVGWADRQGGRRELVLFDLETMSLRPRFCDVAGILPALAARAGRDERALFALYLDSLRGLGGADLPVEASFREARLVGIAGRFAALPWLVRENRPALPAVLETLARHIAEL